LMVHLGAARAGALVDDFELKFCFAVGFSAALGRKSLSDGRSSPAGQKNSTDSRSRSDCRHRNESSVGSYPAARRAFSMRSYSAVSPSTMATLRQRSSPLELVGVYSNKSRTLQQIRDLLVLRPHGRTEPVKQHRIVQNRLRPSQLQQFETDYRAGVPINELARKYEIDRTTVFAHARRMGLSRRHGVRKGGIEIRPKNG